MLHFQNSWDSSGNQGSSPYEQSQICTIRRVLPWAPQARGDLVTLWGRVLRFLSEQESRADRKPRLCFLLVKCIFPFPEVQWSPASLCKFGVSFHVLPRPRLLLGGTDLPKGILFGCVFLRLSYIIIICSASSLPFIIPKYSGEGNDL